MNIIFIDLLLTLNSRKLLGMMVLIASFSELTDQKFQLPPFYTGLSTQYNCIFTFCSKQKFN